MTLGKTFGLFEPYFFFLQSADSKLLSHSKEHKNFSEKTFNIELKIRRQLNV